MLKGYRTVIFNSLMATLALLETTDPDFIPEGYGKWITLSAAIGNIWLRAITTTPIGKAE